jgi:ABC-type branched-subunit amino acid transport system substrate-binding protein
MTSRCDTAPIVPIAEGRRTASAANTPAGRLLSAIAAIGLACVASLARGEDGVTPNSITLGRVIALDGPAGAKGREQEAALEAYFDSLNASGGIHGRKIILRTSNEDLRSEDTLRRLYDTQRPFAFFLHGGTTGSTLAMKYGIPLKIPFVAPNSGANVFHQPPSRWVFNVRARYQDEVIVAVKHFSLVNQRRIALVHVDDAFGRDGAEGYKEGIQATGATSVYEASFRTDQPEFEKLVKALQAAAPDAVICIGSSKRIAELITLARQAGLGSAFMTLSNNSSSGFARELGIHARGVIVSQVTPPPGSLGSRLSRELRQLMAQRADAEVSYAAMEAYASAKVLVEGLRRAGPNLTREGFVQAMESIRRVDIGGLEIDYSFGRRTGSSYVELSILTHDGKYRR